jgi:hypothetical protein
VRASQTPDRLAIAADEDTLIADAGLLLPATLAARLGLPELLDQRITAGAHPGEKCLTVIASALAGGDCIDDVNALRAGATGAVLGHRVAAPSKVGSLLRSLRWGNARQFDAVSRELLARAARAGAIDVAAERFVVDIDATLVETYGLAKRGAEAPMRTGRRGYHPILAVAAGTGDVLHARLRRGRTNDASGAPAFVAETLNRIRAAGVAGAVVLRADTGFYLADVLAACTRAGVGFSIGARIQTRMRTLIAGLEESAWTPVPYFEPGAAVAELGWLAFDSSRARTAAGHRAWRGNGTWVRLIVRRTPTPPGLRDEAQQALFPTFDYHPFITDQPGDPVDLDRFHRAHAEVELAIRDLKHGMGLNHLPTKSFAGNHAWLVLQTLAHNLGRWTARLGDLAEAPRQTIKTLRRRYLAVPGRLVRHARRLLLRLPSRWPWTDQLLGALTRLRALPGPAG